MKNIEAILKDAGVELTEEQKTAVLSDVAANYKTIADYDKQTGKYATLQKQIDDAKAQAQTAEENARKQLEARDYSDAVKAATGDLRFSSAAAKKQFLVDLTSENLPLKDGKLLGLADYIASYKAQDAGAILDAEAEEKRATFTQPAQPGQGTAKDPRTAEFERKLAAVMGVKQEQ